MRSKPPSLLGDRDCDSDGECSSQRPRRARRPHGQRMHWRAAAEIDEALQRFAASGEGSLRVVSFEGRRELRLYIAPFFAWIHS